jgi:hypothetical protein
LIVPVAMALGEGGDHEVAVPLISDQPKHGGIVRSGELHMRLRD